MKKTKIIYWIFTGLLAALMLFSSIASLLDPAGAAVVFTHLGYPLYLVTFLSVAKFLGVIAILIPGFPRLKEWAYAGFVFDLAGAMYSGIAVGDPVSQWGFLFIGFILIAGSYIYYHKKMNNKG